MNDAWASPRFGARDLVPACSFCALTAEFSRAARGEGRGADTLAGATEPFESEPVAETNVFADLPGPQASIRVVIVAAANGRRCSAPSMRVGWARGRRHNRPDSRKSAKQTCLSRRSTTRARTAALRGPASCHAWAACSGQLPLVDVNVG
jgi:hypothetical protein